VVILLPVGRWRGGRLEQASFPLDAAASAGRGGCLPDTGRSLPEAAGVEETVKVSDLMVRDVVTVDPDTSLRDAFRLMTGARVRHLPVVRHGRLVGIISDRDFRLYGMSVAGTEDGDLRFSMTDTPVRDVMNKEPVVIGPDVDLREAVDMFVEEKVGAVPVVDETDHLLGIIGYIDLLELLQDYL
jgi:CBS domain-containing protein